MKKLLCLLFLLFSKLLPGADWPNWLGPTQDGVSTENNWTNQLDDPIWKSKVGIGFSSVVVANGRLFTMGHDGDKRKGMETVYCLDSKTGKTIWTDSYPAPMIDYLHEGGPCATPTIDGQMVYSISKHGHLYAYQAKDGTKLWQKDMLALSGMRKPPEWGFSSSPYVLGNMLLIEAGATFALNKQTGELLWKSENYRPAYGSPISFKIGKSIHVAVLKTDGLVIMDAANGKTLAFEKWETSYRTNACTPIIQGNKIFISTGYRRGCALFQWNGKTLQKIYENKNLSTHMNHAIRVDDFLYGFDGNVHMADPKDFVCIRFSNGEATRAWRREGDTWIGTGGGVDFQVNPSLVESLVRVLRGLKWDRRLDPCCADRRISSNALRVGARPLAEECASPGFSPQPRCLPSKIMSRD